MNEDKLGTLEEAIEFDKKRNYQYTAPVAWMSPDGKVSTTEGKLFHIPLYIAPRELSAKESYDKACIDGEDKDPIERLRFYCSLAMVGQDWLDAEPFFDAIKSAPRELSDELPSPVLQEYFEKGYKCAMESLQLSDEEIMQVYEDCFKEDKPVFIVGFARAIMEKCGIISGTDK